MRTRIPAIAVIASLVAAACGGAATPSAGPSAAPSAAQATTAATKAPLAKVKIMVGGLNKQIYLPNMLTKQLGFFADEGLDADMLDEPSGVDTENEVAAGHVDIGSGSYDHTIDLQAAGKPITCVAVLLREPGEFIMYSTRVADKIKSPKDWKGLKAGVTSLGSGTHTLMRAIAVHNGLQVSDVTYVKAGAGDTFIAGMKNGQIDIGITTQPTVLRLVSQKIAVLGVDLSKPDTTQAAMGGDYPFIALWARPDYIAAHKDVVQKVVNAYVKTLKWIASHKAEDVTAKLPADYSSANKDEYIQALKDSYQMFTPDGKMPVGGPQFVLKTVSSFNDKIATANIDLAKTYDPTFVETANK
ncbi:MAG: ABC transporter substrate-binding protein [Chloroflexota bacterium]|nr:ABC transporter substrate-binding protein [Chloroflexota bacterium]MDE3192371.1 ABC transporter substrate-binding protein [Chloroflexota bacterium]